MTTRHGDRRRHPRPPLRRHRIVRRRVHLSSGVSTVRGSTGTHAVGPSLIETKLRPPTVRAGLVARPDLDARLDEAVTHRLTIVSAPTGYGKTTLVSAWAGRSEARVAWLTVEATDNDPMRLVQYIVAALARAGVSIQARTRRSAAAPGADLAGYGHPTGAQRPGGASGAASSWSSTTIRC